MATRHLFIVVLCTLLAGCTMQGNRKSVHLSYNSELARVVFAVSELNKALETTGFSSIVNQDVRENSIQVSFSIDSSLEEEAFSIVQNGNSIAISGGDATGLMYAGLELADYIKLGQRLSKLGTISETPYLKKRGIKFNIPLDARTPSYDDTGDAAQQNIATMWEFDFWEQFLDNMARNRYNLLTLWSLHPYPSMVKVPEYPDVALDNVCRYNGKIDHETDMKWKGEDIYNPEMLEVIKEMTIDEKIVFWQKVFQYAEDRGIDVHMFHWNVFVHGTQEKHGITWNQDNPITVDYIRQSVKAFLLTYPTVKGIGVTSGEHINRNLTGEYATENWMWLTYGCGVMDAKAINPDIDVRFIFRRHWSNLDRILEAFKDYDGKFETSFKYSRARMFSSVSPPWFDKMFRREVEERGLKCWLNVRNDDIFTFRWGDPDYAKTYIKNMPYDLIPGFYWGPDGYVYGREFISKNPQTPRQLEIDKHWYTFMIWGRASYNPNLDAQFFKDQLSLKFPGVNAELLFNTWKATSDIISLTDKIHFRQNDALFAPEGCFGKYGADKGFHDVNNFIRTGSMPLQDLVSIADYAHNQTLEGITPFQLADSLDMAAEILLKGVQKIKAGSNMELKETLGDLEALAYLGKYYAMKVRGATYTAMFRVSGNESLKTNAISALEQAVNYWVAYAKIANTYYHPQLYARTQMLNWDEMLEFVKKDVDIAREAKHGDRVKVEDDNFLWDRDAERI